MKKYLMTGIAALAIGGMFTSCSHDMSLYNGDGTKAVEDKYEQAFVDAYGEPAANQTWGFGSTTVAGTRGMTRSNTGVDYPSTSTGINANANEWADPTKEFGGWQVPDPLTEGQKERVKAYFQANPNLSYQDPGWRHFFVQQTYKGKTSVGANSPETITAANGTVYDSDNMDLLTVGANHQHINNYNAGNCSVRDDVLTNGGNVNDGPYHSDQIMLMVNIDDTSCFGYHDSGSSTHHDNKAALVAASVIDAWAAQHGNPGEAVVDKWNRSFLGFDLAIKEGAEACERDGNGNVVYATYNQAPESPQYAWDGEKIIQITTGETEIVTVGNEWATWTETRPVYKDEFKTIMNRGWLSTNENFYVAGQKETLQQNISINRTQISSLSDIQNCVVLKEVMDGDQWYQSVINLPRIKQLVDAGYLPVNNKNLTEWVKVGTSDGYFSDWIVTLTEAKRIPQGGGSGSDKRKKIRVIAEDLSVNSATNEKSDFDFNDIVFDVFYDEDNGTVSIKPLAAGGELQIYIGSDDNAWELHHLFMEAYPTDPNVTANSYKINTVGNHYQYDCPEIELPSGWWDHSKTEIGDIANSIMIRVKKNNVLNVLTAEKGKVASKIAVGTDYEWCEEREDIDDKYFGKDDKRFTKFVGGQYDWNTWYKK